MPDTDGLLYKQNLLMGADELQWLQLTNDENARHARMASMRTYGLVIGRMPDGSLETQWRVHDDDDDGSISIEVLPSFADRPEYAMMVGPLGYVAILDRLQADLITLPNDNTWHTITAEASATQYEMGILTLTAGSAVINGTDTDFLNFSGLTSSGFGRGTLIRIDAADSVGGNAGTYEIDQVVSATQIILTAAIPGANETISRFTVAGEFLTGPPADPDIHQRRVVEVTRQTGIQREPTSGRVPLADVKRNDALVPRVQIIDRRSQRLYRTAVPGGLHTSSIPALLKTYNDELSLGLSTSPTPAAVAAYTGVVDVVANALCPCMATTGDPYGTLLMTDDGGTIFASRDDPAATAFTPGFLVTGGSFAGEQPALARLPPGSGFTHVCCYIDTGVLMCRRSTDDGTTWAGAITVLDPTAIDPLDTAAWPSVIRLINGRLHVAIEYYDDSGAVTGIVGAISDDHGATWDTNGGAGYAIKSITVGPVNVGRPSLGQSADGRIWCAHTVGTADIGITSTESPLGTWPGILSTANNAMSDMNPNNIFDNVNTPVLWVSPDGQPIIVFHGYEAAGQNAYLMYAVIGYQTGGNGYFVQSFQKIWRSDTTLAAVQDLGIALCQDIDGAIRMAWAYTVPVGAADTYATRLLPVSLPFQEGGNNRYRSVS